jgi:predicted ATPase/signal transduction histidine kinase
VPAHKAAAPFAILAVLGEDSVVTLARANRQHDRRRVLVKLPSAAQPALATIRHLVHEYELRDQLDQPWAVRPLDLDHDNNERMALTLEDRGGQPLEALIETPLPLERALLLAGRIAGAVARMHANRLVHCDLRPFNILVSGRSDRVRLSGFGLARPLTRMAGPADRPALIEGALAYMAPEQTGWMNRAIDARSDLYALGVIFYRMFAGCLPFTAADATEWVHCHLARRPSPPSERRPELPKPVSDIVLKLLAKAPEARYQTAAALVADLDRCREQWQTAGAIAAFPLASGEIADRLATPQRLSGRTRELGQLVACYEAAVRSGHPCLALIVGESGIGKSALARELYKPILRDRGFFAAGWFEPHRGEAPYAPVVAALRGLVEQILGESEERLGAWRQRIQAALAANGRIMTELIPPLELLIGPQPALATLPAGEAESRFRFVFERFVGAFADPAHPLILFLDDLQWADAASVALLRHFATMGDGHPLLLLGAYRREGVGPDHPLAGLTRSSGAACPMIEIALAPLGAKAVAELVGDSLGAPPAAIAGLANLVLQKSGGNPFFALQFITHLYDAGLLVFDRASRTWRWDNERIRAEPLSATVAELLIGKLRRFPAATQHALQLAACLGVTAEAERLAIIIEQPREVVARMLDEPLAEGLIVDIGEAYRFLHDRVHHAAYSLIEPGKRAALHLRIGRRLRAKLAGTASGPTLFAIAGQLNTGAALIVSAGERYALAELDLRAGREAMAMAAYATARQCLGAGLRLLPPTAWAAHHELAMAIHRELAQCEFICGDRKTAEALFEAALARAHGKIEQAGLQHLRASLHAHAGEFASAMGSGLAALRRLGITIPLDEAVWPEAAEIAIATLQRRLAAMSEDELAALPETTAERPRLIARLVADLRVPAYFTSGDLVALLEVAGVEIALSEGASESSPNGLALFGTLLAPDGDLELTARLGAAAKRLGDRLSHPAVRARLTASTVTLDHWRRPLGTLIAEVQASCRAGFEHGDFIGASHNAVQIAVYSLAAGRPLDEFGPELERLCAALGSAGAEFALTLLRAYLRAVETLRRAGPPPDAPACALRLPSLDVLQLQLCYLLGDYDAALAHAKAYERAPPTRLRLLPYLEFVFFYALAIAARYPAVAQEEQARMLPVLERLAAIQQGWARACPANHAHKAALVAAELARITGTEKAAQRLYEEAIEAARRSGLVHHAALCYELAARFHLSRGFTAFGQLYMREACAAYAQWGARAKLQQIEDAHSWLAAPQRLLTGAALATETRQLDLLAVVKASQALSSEIELDALLEKLMRLVVEHAGARRGLLVRRRNSLQIVAAAAVEGDGIVASLIPEDVSASNAAESVLHFVERTGETVILQEANGDPRFSGDAYLRARQPKSLLCQPLHRRGRVIGLLHLENDLVAGSFPPERIATLQLLASQAAISLENATLFAERRETESALRVAKEQAEGANRAKSLFLANISHELRTPLNAVIGFSELMASQMFGPLGSPRYLQYVNDIQRSAEHLLDLINDVLDLSKAEVGRLDLHEEIVDLAAIIEGCFRLLQPQAERAGIALLAPPARAPPLRADPRMMRQIVLNLVSNAIKFTPTGGRVEVTLTRAANGGIVLVVADTGIGIATADIPRVFETFTQLDNRLERKFQGTGLGLPLSKLLVELHGGVIVLDSTPGSGTCVTIRLPPERLAL